MNGLGLLGGKVQIKSKAREKRCILSRDLKVSTLWAALIWKGRLIQSLGAEATKALSPLVLSLVLSTTSSSWP